MKKNKLFWILTVVCVLNFAAHLYFYPSPVSYTHLTLPTTSRV